jgi:hypothetical protein
MVMAPARKMRSLRCLVGSSLRQRKRNLALAQW